MPRSILRVVLVLLSLLIGPAMIGAVVLALSGGSPNLDISEEAGILTLNAMLVSLPFFVLALLYRGGVFPWLVGLALTNAFWGYVVYDAARNPEQGANIGHGLLLLASPFLILIICVAAAYRPREVSRAG